MSTPRRTFLEASLLAGLSMRPREGFGPAGPVQHLLSYAPGQATDDAAAIQDLLNQAAAVSGTVELKAASQPYQIDRPLRIPPRVSLIGQGPGTRIEPQASIPALIQIDSATTEGNRLGRVGHLFLDGKGQAEIGLDLGLSVQRMFLDLSVVGCSGTGIRVAGGQNNTFVSVNAERNGSRSPTGGGLELLAGAGNNTFLRCEVNSNAPYQLSIHGPGSRLGAFDYGPTGNAFIGSVFERKVPASQGCLLAGGGRQNIFVRCDFSHDGDVLLRLPDGSAPKPPLLWVFLACAFSGSATTQFTAGTGGWRLAFDRCLMENFSGVGEASANTLDIDEHSQLSNVGSWASARLRYAPGLRVEGGSWNTGHIVLGDYHLWVDPSGALRLKRGSPDGPTDGTPVGAP